MRWIFAATAALWLLSPQNQGPDAKLMQAYQDSFKARNEGKYLKALTTIEDLYNNGSSDLKSEVGDMLSQEYAFVEDTESSLRVIHSLYGPAKEDLASLPELDAAKRDDAVWAVLREARGRQVVILNEAHHMPRSRAFALEIARGLRKAGFTIFAAETFTSKDLDKNWAKGYPSLNMGNYTQEPFFGDLVRECMRLGYKPIAYEAEKFKQDGDVWDRINDREIQEANNLIERGLKAHPKDRIFVYCGYSHATENWGKSADGRDKAWMAARVKKLTGVDPLTIDQTGGMEEGDSAMENPAFRYADKKGLLGKDVVFRMKDGGYFTAGAWKDAVDMQVYHPRQKMIDGRPDWMRMGGYRKPLPLDSAVKPASGKVLVQAFVESEPDNAVPMDQVIVPEDKPKSGKVLVQAFVESEPDNAVPMDQVIVSADKPLPVLLVPKGKYRIVVQDAEGTSRIVGHVTQR